MSLDESETIEYKREASECPIAGIIITTDSYKLGYKSAEEGI